MEAKDANGNVWSDANLATALGGITRGVTNVDENNQLKITDSRVANFNPNI